VRFADVPSTSNIYSEVSLMSTRNTIEYVKNYLEERKHKLISKEYINALTNIDIQCPKGHIFSMRFNSFQQGQRCPDESGKKPYTEEEIRKYVENTGYKIITFENSLNITFKCPDETHPPYKTSFSIFKCRRCGYCAPNKKKEQEYIVNYYNKFKYTFNDIYENSFTNHNVICPNDHIWSVKFNSFQQGQRCPLCVKINDCDSMPESDIIDHIKTIYDGVVKPNEWDVVKNPWTNKRLQLDIYIPGLNKAIEYNGPYHYIDMTYMLDGFIKQQWRDEMKVKQCKQLGIDLLVINGMKWQKEKQNILEQVKNFVLNI
jgi:hypothetical protein